MKSITETLLEIVPIPTTTYNTKAMSSWILENLKHYTPKGCTPIVNHDKYGNIYYQHSVITNTKHLYPTMVCHIDTVHQINNDVKAFIHDKTIYAMDTITMTQFGTGGDDKVGIAITLDMISRFDNFKAVFFLDEEHGCVGSSACNPSFFDDSTFVLQCDRRGSSDFINRIGSTKLYSKNARKAFSDILKKYDRKETSGGITDVGQIAKMNTVMTANMSCGYYNPHSSTETINLDVVENTASMCNEILKATSSKRYAYNSISERTYTYSYTKTNYNYHNHYKPFTFKSKKKRETMVDENLRHDYELDESMETLTADRCLFCDNDQLEYDPTVNEIWCYQCEQYIDDENLKLKTYDENQSNIYDNNEDTFNLWD
tara:strand:+ start:1729 stop:2847 length:1119 start_codon:yes stop_codon:yes gene_type:complete